MSSASPPDPSGYDDRNFWIQVADPVALTITIFLALSFITAITRFRRWHTSLLLRCFLNLAKKPLFQLLGSAVLIGIDVKRELYIVWAVLLFTGFGTFFSIVDYSIYTSNKRKLMQNNELMQLSNNFTVLLLVLIYRGRHEVYSDGHEVYPGGYEVYSSCHGVPNGHGVFTAPLWTIWGLSLTKIFYRMASFYFVDCLYGSANSKLVALHMKREQNVHSFDPETMMGCKYLLLGEKPAKVGDPPIYEIQVNIDDAITIERVWRCEGSLLSSGNQSERLKDTCLSFALFKMLNRRFEEECDTAEADRPETRGFICHGLLTFPTERVFRVIDMEVRFLRELFYTKYPVTFGFGFPWVDVLLFVSNMSIFVFTFLELNRYKDPDWKIDCKQINKDVTVTAFIISVVMIMEVWEFTRYFLSDWSKVLIVCQYVHKWKILDRLLIGQVLWVLCSIYLGGHTINKIGQISLLDSYRTSCGNCINRTSCRIMGYRRTIKKATYVSLKEGKIMVTVLSSLKGLLQTGWSPQSQVMVPVPLRQEVAGEVPAWAFERRNPVLMIMMWHVATSFCLMAEKEQAPPQTVKIAAKVAATSLSNYCAYLIIQMPELLPISSFASNLIFERTLSEMRNFFSDSTYERTMLDKMNDVGDNEVTVIGRGAQLGKNLQNAFKGQDEELWNFLKEVWAYLLLSLAPSENSVAHAKQLAGGGEFITYLWVLLYHAGILGTSSTV